MINSKTILGFVAALLISGFSSSSFGADKVLGNLVALERTFTLDSNKCVFNQFSEASKSHYCFAKEEASEAYMEKLAGDVYRYDTAAGKVTLVAYAYGYMAMIELNSALTEANVKKLVQDAFAAYVTENGKNTIQSVVRALR